MKKSIVITAAALATMGLTAFNWMSPNDPVSEPVDAKISAAAVSFNWRPGCTARPEEVELFYDVAPRFMTTVTKEVLNAAKTILDIVPVDPDRSIVSYSSVRISIIDDNTEQLSSETGDGPQLTAAQIKLLRSVDYSTNILIQVRVKNKVTGGSDYSYATPHITVVPEKQAVNTGGKDALITYVKMNTTEFATIVTKDELKAGKAAFHVSKAGKVTQATIATSSGYPAFDEKMIELINSLPGTWEPATNANGETVEQKFVFSFGIIGC